MSEIVSLWGFSCNVYQQTGVEKACLLLQQQWGVDIPLLLFCCWAAGIEGKFSLEQLEKACTLSNRWTEGCIGPVRAIRQNMKLMPMPPKGWENIREQIKANELAAEKCLLEELEAGFTGKFLPKPQYLPILMEYIQYCFPTLFALDNSDVNDQEVIALVATIVHAAQSDIQYHSHSELMTRIRAHVCP